MGLGHHAPEPRAVEPPQHGRLVTEPMVVGLHHCYRRCAQGEEPCTLLAVWASRSASAPGRNNTPWGMIESRGPTIAGKLSAASSASDLSILIPSFWNENRPRTCTDAFCEGQREAEGSEDPLPAGLYTHGEAPRKVR